MAIKYEICTEAISVGWIRGLATLYFPEGYSLTQGVGCYKGIEEAALTVTAIDADPVVVQQFAKEIKEWNKQESVLVITTTCDAQYI